MGKKRKAYPSDLTDKQWLLIKPLLSPEKKRGKPRTVDFREVINAIFYLLHIGYQWDYLPHDFPPHDTVYGYFQQWQGDGTWEKINNELRGCL